jgi:hypothetical protein
MDVSLRPTLRAAPPVYAARAAKDFDPSQIHIMLNLLSFVSFANNCFEFFNWIQNGRDFLGALGELDEQSEKKRA